MDEIARLVGAQAALFVCGERPGLGFADSMSAYYIYQPAAGATDADREVISNINPRGRPPADAAGDVAAAIERILREKKSGVVLARVARHEDRPAARSSRARWRCARIPDASDDLARAFGLPAGRRALGIITATSDDALYAALDQGTKASPADVVYAKSFYAGANYPSGPLSGECIGVYAARDPAEIDAALDACLAYLETEAWFYARDDRRGARPPGRVLPARHRVGRAATWRRWPTSPSAARSPT